MLDWIKGSKSDHPLADDAAARELIAELPAADSYKMLEELSYWLDTLAGAEDLKLVRLLEIIDLIDQTAKNHQRKLAQDYLSGGGRMQKYQEHRIWSTSTVFWRRLASAYRLWLDRFQSGAGGWGGMKGQVPMVVARAIRAGALVLKWQLLRYGPIERDLLVELGRLYAYAETKDFATAAVVVYPGAHGESTAQREFLKAMMLTVSSTDSLLPAKLEVAERIIARFSEFFLLQRQFGKGCHYFIELGAGKMPARVVERPKASEALRFFGPGAAAQELEKLISVIGADGAVPASMKLDGNPDPGLVFDVLRHLARYWSPVPPARSEQRRTSISQISVVHDFHEILSTISGQSDELSFDTSTETWAVQNESEGGYGAVLPLNGSSDWLKVGTLLGVKLEDGAAWGVGIVRRLSAIGAGQRYVGIQLLARGATAVKLVPPNAANDRAGQDALLLPSSAKDSMGSGEMNLLLPLGSFAPKQSYEMRTYGRSYLLMPRQLVEGGQDFDMARYRVMQKSA
jgi:hypothetical protein